MATILYTTTEKIRACIGCDDQDLPDEIVNNRNLDLLMEERLELVFPTHATATIASDLRKLALWCMYFGALTLIEDASLSIAQKIQANTDQLQRFDIDFEQLKKDLRAKLSNLESVLNPEQFSTAGVAPQLIGLATAAYDVITGSGT